MPASTTKIAKVLLVDDDENVRLIVQMSIQGLTDWNLLIATSGFEALSIVREERPDLILLDMMMPEMDGITVLAELQKEHTTTMPHVIFMTAKVQTQEVEKYIKLGATGVITKPFDPMTLPEQIQDIVAQAS